MAVSQQQTQQKSATATPEMTSPQKKFITARVANVEASTAHEKAKTILELMNSKAWEFMNELQQQEVISRYLGLLL